jgi:hypothetical protein
VSAVAAAEPVVNVSLAAKQYVQAGLVLVAFDRGSKGPHHKGWNLRANCIDSIAQASNLYGNIGLAHAYSRTCCIDIDEMTLAASWFAGAGIDLADFWSASDAVRMTSGMPNRGKLLYRLPPHVATLPTRMFKGEGVELRCATAAHLTVQDVLPPSIHPVTGKPYSWIGPGTWRDIPLIPADLLAFWLALCAPKEGAQASAPVGVGREDIEAVLERIKPETLAYGDWLHVGMGLNYECGGNAVGLELWDQWSVSDGKNPLYKGREELIRKWEGFDPKHPDPRTLRTIERLAGAEDMSGEYEAQPEAAPQVAPAAAPPPKAGLLHVQPVLLAALLCAPPEPEIIVESLLLMDACGFVAPGGTGKTTLAIHEAIHIILGRPLWGRQVFKPGRVLFLTAEDSRQIVTTRLNHICKALELTPAEFECVADGFYIEDLSMIGARLVGSNPKTGVIQATKLVSEIVERYRGLNVSLVHLDPASLLGPGEQSGNDGMAELMRAARRIAGEVRAACQIVHHVAQAVARNGIQDQYAGRGGTAFADNSRGQRQLVRVKERSYEFDGRRYRMPDEITDEHMAEGDVLAILVHKLSYVKLDPRPIFVLRRGYGFTQFEATAAAAKVHRTVDEQTQMLVGFIEHELANGVTHSIKSVETSSEEIGLSQMRIRSLITVGLERRVFAWQESTQKGGKQRYLIVPEALAEDLQ